MHRLETLCYVLGLFNIFSFKFCCVQAKAEIRRLLPGGLQESISKVRSSVVSFVYKQPCSTCTHKEVMIGRNNSQLKAEIHVGLLELEQGFNHRIECLFILWHKHMVDWVSSCDELM